MTLAISGLNHLTLAVSDLLRSMEYYRDVLGCVVRAVGPDMAYLEAGSLWLCLTYDPQAEHASGRDRNRRDYGHIAFDIAEENFAAMKQRILRTSRLWKDNSSEGPSPYFLDPDGHRLEIHVGSLESRLAHYRKNPPEGMQLY